MVRSSSVKPSIKAIDDNTNQIEGEIYLSDFIRLIPPRNSDVKECLLTIGSLIMDTNELVGVESNYMTNTNSTHVNTWVEVSFSNPTFKKKTVKLDNMALKAIFDIGSDKALSVKSKIKLILTEDGMTIQSDGVIISTSYISDESVKPVLYPELGLFIKDTHFTDTLISLAEIANISEMTSGKTNQQKAFFAFNDDIGTVGFTSQYITMYRLVGLGYPVSKGAIKLDPKTFALLPLITSPKDKLRFMLEGDKCAIVGTNGIIKTTAEAFVPTKGIWMKNNIFSDEAIIVNIKDLKDVKACLKKMESETFYILLKDDKMVFRVDGNEYPIKHQQDGYSEAQIHVSCRWMNFIIETTKKRKLDEIFFSFSSTNQPLVKVWNGCLEAFVLPGRTKAPFHVELKPKVIELMVQPVEDERLSDVLEQVEALPTPASEDTDIKLLEAEVNALKTEINTILETIDHEKIDGVVAQATQLIEKTQEIVSPLNGKKKEKFSASELVELAKKASSDAKLDAEIKSDIQSLKVESESIPEDLKKIVEQAANLLDKSQVLVGGAASVVKDKLKKQENLPKNEFEEIKELIFQIRLVRGRVISCKINFQTWQLQFKVDEA